MKSNMKSKGFKKARTNIKVFAITFACFLLTIGLYNSVNAEPVYEYSLNNTFAQAGDLDVFTTFGTPEIYAGQSVVRFDNEEGLRFDMSNTPSSHFKEYIRFMVTGAPSAGGLGVSLFSMGYNDYPSYWTDSGYLYLYERSTYNIPGYNLTLTLRGIGSSSYADIRYNTWYEYTADVYYCGLIKNATLSDMWGPVYSYSDITGRDAGQYNCCEAENREITFGSWLSYPTSDPPDISIDRIAIYWDNTTIPADIGIAATDIGKLIYSFIFFLPILIMTWTLGKAGFIISASVMSVIWMATQPDFTWEGIMIIGTAALTTIKGGF